MSSSAPKPHRRAFISLNVDSHTDHLYERVEDHTKPDSDRKKITVRQQSQPTAGSSSAHILTGPYEKEVTRSLERVVDGRVVRDTVTQREDDSTPKSTRNEHASTRHSRIEEKYDTSDL